MKKSLCMLLFFAAALYLLPLIFRPLTGPEEFRTAELAREMLEQGNFLVPKLLGGRYFEAPPLATWLTAASFRIFGLNTFGLRFVSLLAVLGSGALLFLWFRKRAFSFQSSLNTVFILLSGLLFIAAGTTASADALWGFFMTAAMIFSGVAMEPRSRKEGVLALAGVGIAIGCGFLTKGFYALLLPLPAAMLCLLWQKKFKEMLLFPWLPLLTAAAVVAPWGLAIHRAEPDFWHQFAVYGEFRRFLQISPVACSLRLGLVAAGMLPWIFPVLTCMTQLRQGAWTELRQALQMRLALSFMTVSLLFLLLPWGNPLSGLLPCFVSAAAAGALVLDKMDGEKALVKLRKTTTIVSFLFILGGSAALLTGIVYLLWGTGIISSLPLKLAVWAPFFTTAALGMVVAGTFLFIHRKSKLPEPESFFMLCPIAAAVCVWFFPGFTADSRMPEYEMLDIASQLSAANIRHPRLLASPEAAYPAAWCFKDSTVQLVNDPRELEYAYRYAAACGERPLMLTFEQITVLIKSPDRKEGVLLAMRKNDLAAVPAFLLAEGKLFTTAGELCALYYPGKEDKKTEK